MIGLIHFVTNGYQFGQNKSHNFQQKWPRNQQIKILSTRRANRDCPVVVLFWGIFSSCGTSTRTIKVMQDKAGKAFFYRHEKQCRAESQIIWRFSFANPRICDWNLGTKPARQYKISQDHSLNVFSNLHVVKILMSNFANMSWASVANQAMMPPVANWIAMLFYSWLYPAWSIIWNVASRYHCNTWPMLL